MPSHDEDIFTYFRDHYSDRLSHLEATVDSSSQQDLEEAFSECASLHSAYTMLKDEGYPQLARLDREVEGTRRLNTLVARFAETLGRGLSEFELLHRKTPVDEEMWEAGEVYPLEEYLEHLREVARAPTPHALNSDDHRNWIEAVAPVQEKVLEFGEIILAKPNVSKYLSLLRDTLLVQFYLESRIGEAGRILGLPIGRTYLGLLSGDPDDKTVYREVIMAQLYKSLKASENFAELKEHFVRALREHPNPVLQAALAHIREQIETWADGERVMVVESGCQGTMPLLILAATGCVQDFTMYTSFPWLQKKLRPALASTSYQHLWALEAFVCQSKLFMLERVEGMKVFVRESGNPDLRACAYQEIWTFFRRMEAQNGGH